MTTYWAGTSGNAAFNVRLKGDASGVSPAEWTEYGYTYRFTVLSPSGVFVGPGGSGWISSFEDLMGGDHVDAFISSAEPLSGVQIEIAVSVVMNAGTSCGSTNTFTAP